MNKAELYQKANVVQRRDAECVIGKFGHLTNVRENDWVIDVGTGSGDVVVDYVYPRFQCRNVRIIATDVSEEMLAFARRKYEKLANVSFELLDVEAVDVGEQFRGRFHHVFSFHCLNWIRSQEYVHININ
jgi:ubiquinone/menaquinone biosynthesis C-methylase UbiE